MPSEAEDDDRGGHDHGHVQAEIHDEAPIRPALAQIGSQGREERPRAPPEVEQLAGGGFQGGEGERGDEDQEIAQVQRQDVPDGNRALARDGPEIRGREADQGEDQAEADDGRDPRLPPDEEDQPQRRRNRGAENGRVGQTEPDERRSV
jgi:hypothetical protein